jgi:carbonic anhydrase/acetyltransferase-like protein (isoleucine patch superfamily)
MIQNYEGFQPQIGQRIYMHASSVIIGKVFLDDDVSIWPGAILRADLESIRVGKRTNVQDGCVFHTDRAYETIVGSDCVIGHQACVHACKIGNCCLIGIQAIVLTGSEIGNECIIGAGTLITEETKIPDRSLVVGVPGRIIRKVTDADVQSILKGVNEYLHLRQQLTRYN